MFTAILTEASDKPSETGHFSYAIVYTDGISIKYEKRYTTDQLTDELIRQVASAEISRLDRVAGKREIQPGSEIPLLNAAPPDEAAQLAAQKFDQFIQARRLLAGFKIAAAEGFIAADDKRLAATEEQVRSLWDEAWIDRLARI